MRFSYFSLFVLFSMTVAFASAQTTTPLVHTIQKGETLSGLAKKYSTNVGSIMRLNGMNSKSILQLGAEIKIPPANAPIIAAPTEPKPATAPESKTIVSKPLATPAPITKAVAPKDTLPTTATHTVAAKEGLYAIAKKYKITLAQLRQWNQLSNENIQIGQVLYVAPPTSQKAVEKPKRAPIEKDSLPDIKIRAAVPEKASLAAATAATVIKVAKAPIDTTAAIIKQTPTVKTSPSASVVEATNAGTIVDATIPSTLSQPPSYKEIDAIAGTKKWVATEGYFALYFDRKNIDNNGLNGESGIFKTVSGWADKKYYILLNGVEPGTIVRVTATNGKSVCAKVLNALPAMKDDNGLICRINNAAATQLGIDDANRFLVAIHF